MQTATSRIYADSRRQAMDWALVLASQGIECELADEPEPEAWPIIIHSDDSVRADESIRAYEKENTTSWRQEVRWTGMLFDWRSLFWWLAVVGIFVLGEFGWPGLVKAGVLTPSFRSGEWWRAFTAVTLHADAPHLALNSSIGLALLGLAMGFYGPGRAVLAAFLAGAAANSVEVFLRVPPYECLGASGMVMGSLGMLGAQSIFERHYSAREWIGRGVLAAALLFTRIGLNPKSDVLAHLLGFSFGLLFGAALCAGRRFLLHPASDAAARILCIAILLSAWAAALTKAKH